MPGIRRNPYLICGLVVCLFSLVFLGGKLQGDTWPVVLDGQLVPGIPNARFSALRQASVNPSGTLAFFAQMDINGALSSGIFQVRDGVLSLVARRGEPLPDTPGRVFGLAFGDPQINKSGDIAFTANFEGNVIPRGVFVSSAGVLRKVFDTNLPVPEIPDFYFNGVDPVRMNDAGNIAFVAELAPIGGGSGDSGLFLLSNGDLRLIARHVVRSFAFNNRGDIAFVDQQGGITLFSNGVLRPVVVAGQIAINSSIKVSGPAEPWINDDGDVAFVNYGGVTMTGRGASVPAPNAILRWHNGTLTKIAAAGDPVPGLDGSVFDISFNQPEINQSGVIFWNRTVATKDRASVAVIGRFQQEQLSTIVRGGELVEGIGPLDPHTGANFDNETGPVATILAATPAASEGIFALTFVRSTLLFPQVADGTSPGGDWRTTFIFANRSTSAAAATITFYDNAGTPINIATGGQSQNPISISIPPLGVTRIQTDGTGDLKVGWAKVQSDQNISGAALFAFSNASGKLASEVSASATTPLRSFSVFVDTGSDTSTGVAIVNPNAFANDVTLILRDAASNEVARSSVNLPAMGHLSLYANELFPALPSGPFSGRIEVASAQNLVGLTLRQHEDVFTSLPIIP